MLWFYVIVAVVVPWVFCSVLVYSYSQSSSWGTAGENPGTFFATVFGPVVLPVVACLVAVRLARPMSGTPKEDPGLMEGR